LYQFILKKKNKIKIKIKVSINEKKKRGIEKNLEINKQWIIINNNSITNWYLVDKKVNVLLE